MPRTYKRAEGARKYGYSAESMQRAVIDVKENAMSIKKAAFVHSVNRTTLLNHLKAYRSGPVGRPTLLTNDEERVIVHALIKLGEWGFGVDRNAVQCIVKDYLQSVGREHHFQHGKPGIDWMYGFEKRWRNELTRRVAQPLPANRAYACNSAVVNDFFENITSIYERLGLRGKPQNVFNVDETGFQTDIGSQMMFCKRGARNPHKTVATSTKCMYTVQVCCSAVGEYLPMYVVYKGKHLYNTWCSGGPKDVLYTCSDSGWMESQQFIEWFAKVFVAGTSSLDGAKLLIFDGHSSHISPHVVELAVQNNIELLCLPAHTSSILQPLDVGVFKAVKSAWRKCLHTYYDETSYSNVDKRAFPCLLKRLCDGGAFSRVNAINAFDACGIYPLNREKITSDKLSTSIPLTHQVETSQKVDEPVREETEVEVPLSSVSSNTILTPRKAVETALLSHLKQITPPDKNEKRSRVRRTLAECLTSDEVQKRMREDEADKQMKLSKKGRKTPKALSAKTAVPEIVIDGRKKKL